ncbi:MAG: hypothetical protein JXR49_22105 [Acidobacteria bacterium]|nr:hypothetical protein [Acidobacteriota bacterium]
MDFKYRFRIISGVIVFYMSLSGLIVAEDLRLYVGVLEECSDQEFSNHNLSKRIRPLFMKKEAGWQSLEEKIADKTLYPDETRWTIAFDGRCLNTFRGIQKDFPQKFEWHLPRIIAQIPDGSYDLPQFGEPNREFSGFTAHHCYRPLVVLSNDKCTDPKQWRSFSPQKAVIDSIKPDFLKHLHQIHFTCPDVDIQNPPLTVAKSYKSKTGNMLVNIETKCAVSMWFYIDQYGKKQNLSSLVDWKYILNDFGGDNDSTMRLVDAGDYDGDGDSEVVFWISRYNRDGYIMFYEGFEKFIEFSWGYH